MKRKIAELLVESFDSVYCNTCNGAGMSTEDDDYNCDECHRKMMNWSLSYDYAEKTANKIIEIVKGGEVDED